MMNRTLSRWFLVGAILLGASSLSACKKNDKNSNSVTATPTAVQQVLPLVGDSNSPLPTPSSAASPLNAQ